MFQVNELSTLTPSKGCGGALFEVVPFIVRTKPMTDLCWTCQKNNSAVYNSCNLSEEQKSERLKKQEQHLARVSGERSLYQGMVGDSKKTVEGNGWKLEGNAPCSKKIAMHYSFDFAQQVHYPSDPMQPGPMYFLVPRKCGHFSGLLWSTATANQLPDWRQINYLIDEAVVVGKGSNAVISYLHDFFEHWGLGEETVHINCDNCSGQNKNNYVLWYLLWRVMTGLHVNVELHFLIAGHTKFAPDWCFGLIKQCYRRTRVSSLEEFAQVVRDSSQSGVNIPSKVDLEDGTVLVKTYDWQAFLLKALKKYHHFR